MMSFFCTKKLTNSEQKLYSMLMMRCFSYSFFLLATMAFNSGEAVFSDVTPQDMGAPMIQHLSEVGVMNGYGDGLFYPERMVSRAEALTIALRAAGHQRLEPYGGETYFEDIDPNSWYAPLVALGVERRIVLSKQALFKPEAPVSKAEFLAFLFRATKVDFTHHFNTRSVALDIPDDAWFVPHFAYAKKYQIAHLPVENYYHPYKALSRREVAMMTYRQLRLFHGTADTKIMVELQAQIQNFLTATRSGKTNQAERYLHEILKLSDRLVRTKNSGDALAFRSISQAMENLSESLRRFRAGRNLDGISTLYIALKQVRKAEEKPGDVGTFARDLGQLIEETLMHFSSQSDLLTYRD